MMQSSHGWPGIFFLFRLIDVNVRHHEDTADDCVFPEEINNWIPVIRQIGGLVIDILIFRCFYGDYRRFGDIPVWC